MLEEKLNGTFLNSVWGSFRRYLTLGAFVGASAIGCSGGSNTELATGKTDTAVSNTFGWNSGNSPDTYSPLKETSCEKKTFFLDQDGDNYGIKSKTKFSCEKGDGYSDNFLDCDDNPKTGWNIHENCPKNDADAFSSNVDASSGSADVPISTDTSTDIYSTCKPNCAEKVCGDDGCGGSCGGCGVYEKCLSNGECDAYTDEEIMTNSTCTITDSIKFSMDIIQAGHNLQYNNEMTSANSSCAGGDDKHKGIECGWEGDCWAQWDMTVDKNCDVIILEVGGDTIGNSDYTPRYYNGLIDNLPFNEAWSFDCKNSLSKKEAIKTTDSNEINFTSDKTVTLKFTRPPDGSNWSFLIYADIKSCYLTKGD